MRTRIKTSLLFAALIIVFACDDSAAEPESSYLEVNTVDLSFDEQTTQSLNIEANGRWNVKMIKGGTNFSVTPTQGIGPGEITIKLERTTSKAVSGKLQINYLDERKDEQSIYREIKMEAGELNIASTQNITFTRRIAEIPVDINWIGAWTAELSDTENYSIDNESGEGYNRINVRVNNIREAGNADLVIIPAEHPRVKVKVKINSDKSFSYESLNEATVGEGIDIVFLGDGFTEEDIENGKWDMALDTIRAYMFETEPFKTYKKHFNIYALPHPFEGTLYGDGEVKTELATYNPDKGLGESIEMKRDVISKYAFENTPVSKNKKDFSKMLVCLLLNADKGTYSGWCSRNIINPTSFLCMGIAPCNTFAKYCHRSIFTHELMGHGFGGFLDEYYGSESGTGTWPEDEIPTKIENWTKWDDGWNLCYSDSDPTKIPENWWKLSQIDEYKPYVGFYEGGHAMFRYGVWRCTWHSVMNSSGEGGGSHWYNYYSPVQREILLYRIYKLSGMEKEYSLDKFIEYDVINREMDAKYKKIDEEWQK